MYPPAASSFREVLFLNTLGDYGTDTLCNCRLNVHFQLLPNSCVVEMEDSNCTKTFKIFGCVRSLISLAISAAMWLHCPQNVIAKVIELERPPLNTQRRSAYTICSMYEQQLLSLSLLCDDDALLERETISVSWATDMDAKLDEGALIVVDCLLTCGGYGTCYFKVRSEARSSLTDGFDIVTRMWAQPAGIWPHIIGRK
ncbi:hypothetical protein B0H10DRAFT_1969075 [Mycena sp. CBHHK59/15]|nr:hypothetical protein B0H10DRAFT_1969075 [Mycena sp. CBHHK59/15]